MAWLPAAPRPSAHPQASARPRGGYDLDRAPCTTGGAPVDGLRELEHDLHQHIHEENDVVFPRALATA